MTYAARMAHSNPSQVAFDTTALIECVQACFVCAQACTACADACLGEQDTKMLLRCIRLNIDCADICVTTGRVLSRQTALEPAMVRAALQACSTACRLCGDECEQHAQHGMRHCQLCAAACRSCEQSCEQLTAALGA